VFCTVWYKPLCVVMGVALVFALIGVVGGYGAAPLGDWDAWALWNLRARFLFRAGEQWRQAFSPVFTHTDYPLLVPCTNARCWCYLGTDPEWGPWLVGSLFTFATVGILATGVCRLRSRCQGLLAGLVLLGTVSFFWRGALQYADIPLAFFFLATVLLLGLYDAADQRRRGLLCLAGLTAALAAWTKNEGWLFVIAVFATRWLAAWRRAGGRQAIRQLVLSFVGAAPVLGIVVLFKTCLAGDNDLVSGQGWQRCAPRLLDTSRYWLVGKAFVTWGLHLGRAFVIVLPLCFMLLGRGKPPSRGAAGITTAASVLLLMIAGYFGVYIVTPHDLTWHLGTSAERVLLHLWPLAILTVFLYLATPEELVGGKAAVMQPKVPAGSSGTSNLIRGMPWRRLRRHAPV
jgi:4-amino-4-deoxy-L-arabinose transferase-like glycosyltransferase